MRSLVMMLYPCLVFFALHLAIESPIQAGEDVALAWTCTEAKPEACVTWRRDGEGNFLKRFAGGNDNRLGQSFCLRDCDKVKRACEKACLSVSEDRQRQCRRRCAVEYDGCENGC